MMAKVLKVLLVLVGLLAIASYSSGITPTYVMRAPAMSTGLSAMLTCTQRYVSGLPKQQSRADLITYSPLLEQVELTYNDVEKYVDADFLGLRTTRAQYREGQGCALEVGDTEPLNKALIPTTPEVPNALWPMGEKVELMQPAVQAKLEEILARDNAAGLQTRALLAVKGGRVIGEAYVPGVDQTTKLLGWSKSKSFNAIMVGNAEMRGLIDQRAKPIFPDWASDERAGISLDDMMHMATGLDLSETYVPGSAVTELLFTAHSAADVAVAVDLVEEPGTHYDYSSGTSNLMSKLVFDVVGGTIDDALKNLQDNFLTPMGMHNTLIETDPAGVFLGSSFMMSSARDWARMGQLMLNGGELNGHRIVTEEWVKRALSPNNTKNTKDYGYQFWLNSGDDTPRWPDLPRDSYAALGSREQVTMTIPSEDMVIVRLGWAMDGTYPTNENFAEIVKAAD